MGSVLASTSVLVLTPTLTEGGEAAAGGACVLGVIWPGGEEGGAGWYVSSLKRAISIESLRTSSCACASLAKSGLVGEACCSPSSDRLDEDTLAVGGPGGGVGSLRLAGSRREDEDSISGDVGFLRRDSSCSPQPRVLSARLAQLGSQGGDDAVALRQLCLGSL